MWIDSYVEVQVVPDVRASFGKNYSHGRNGFGLAVKATANLTQLRQTLIGMLEFTVENYDQPAPVHNAVSWALPGLITETYSDIERRHLYDANMDIVWRASNGILFWHNLRFRLCGGVITEYQAVAFLRLVRENWLLSGGHPIGQPISAKTAAPPPADSTESALTHALKQPRQMPNGFFLPNA